MRSGDIGDEAARSADDAELPLDLAAVRADDDLIEALSAGLVPPPSGPRDPSDVEGELVALLAGWVADVRPESLLHPPASQPAAVKLITASGGEPAEEDEPLAAVGSPAPVRSLLEYEDAEPVTITRRRTHGTRGYLLRAAAGLVAIALIGSGVIVRSYDAHPGDSLWVVAKVVFPAKSRSVEAATAVSTALNTARVALESGRIDDARAAFQSVQDQLAAVDDADGRLELAHQRDYLTAQLGSPTRAAAEQAVAPSAGPPLATGQAGATIPSSPAVTPGAIQALLTPVASPSVLAAPSGDPSATASGAGSTPAAGGSSSPAVVAAPPGDPAVSEPPVVSNPAPSDAVSGSSAGSPPAAASPPPADPVIDPPVSTPSPEPPAPTSAPADPATTVQSTPDPPVDNGQSGGGSDSSANSVANAPADSPSDGSPSGSGDSADSSGAARPTVATSRPRTRRAAPRAAVRRARRAAGRRDGGRRRRRDLRRRARRVHSRRCHRRGGEHRRRLRTIAQATITLPAGLPFTASDSAPPVRPLTTWISRTCLAVPMRSSTNGSTGLSPRSSTVCRGQRRGAQVAILDVHRGAGLRRRRRAGRPPRRSGAPGSCRPRAGTRADRRAETRSTRRLATRPGAPPAGGRPPPCGRYDTPSAARSAATRWPFCSDSTPARLASTPVGSPRSSPTPSTCRARMPAPVRISMRCSAAGRAARRRRAAGRRGPDR